MGRLLTASFHVKGKQLFIGGTEFKNYKILGKLGDGANGVVYKALNTILQREEAVKIWRSRSARDQRNKVEQGLREAQKLARVSPEYAVAIYGAQEINGILVAMMEYVDGRTLEWHLNNSDALLRMQLAEVYLNVIVQTTAEATRHGDAHLKNVLVFEEKLKYETRLRIKLCDFGTSYYSGRESSEQRHWRIVRETILSLTHDLPHVDFCTDTLNTLWPQGVQGAAEAYAARKKGIAVSDHDIATMWAAPLRDYINDLKDLNLRNRAG